MEIAGLVIGASALATLFTAAIDSYRIISAARDDVPGEVSTVFAQLQIEKTKFQMWTDRMEIAGTEGYHRFLQQPQQSQILAVTILTQIRLILADVHVLRDRYGIKFYDEQGKLVPVEKHTTFEFSNLLDFKTQAKKMKGMHNWRWAVRDGGRLEKLAEKLRYFNEGLYTCVPASHIQSFDRGLPSYILASQESLSELSVLSQVAAKRDSLLAESAVIRRVNIQLDNNTTSISELRTSIPEIPSVQLTAYRTEGLRELATHELTPSSEQTVLIEWKELKSEQGDNYRTMITDRVYRLAHFLRQEKPLEFRILTCLGIAHVERSSDHNEKYGFVFPLGRDVEKIELPGTLFDLLQKKTETPPLEDRYKLAHSIASALALLHASKWLHKGLRSQNIIFFRNNRQAADGATPITSPYLAGFDYSRPDMLGEDTEATETDNLYFNIYRHPEVQNPPTGPRYKKEHDIYSLGIILYEIGVWRRITESYMAGTINDFKDLLVQQCLSNFSELSGLMGSRYRDVVVRCLKGDLGISTEDKLDASIMQRAFWHKVVVELESCGV